MDVFLTAVSAFLPNEPVGNAEMEALLGLVDAVPSRTRALILRSNRIRQRYYAIDPVTRRTTHTNAQLTAEAVRRLAPPGGFGPTGIECLACGTSSPDQLMPGHASMVHGELGGGPCEVATTGGICGSGMTALKYAYMSVALGLTGNAVAAGSELASTFLRAELCGGVDPAKAAELPHRPILAFEADFLRWMLSDGAGAVLLEPRPAPEGLSLRVDWIEHRSFAHELETCMWAGGLKGEDGTFTGWREAGSAREVADSRCLLVRQDVKLLNREIVRTSVDRTLPGLAAKRGLRTDRVDWFLPHYSSDFFRAELHERMVAEGFGIPPERWFTNLATKGNTGAASIYIILEELLRSGQLEKGQRLLCFIPESGRFSICYMHLTVC